MRKEKSSMRHLPNINFLRYFYSAGKHKSVSLAAKENFVTQSAISQGINKLEIELGKQLLSKRKNRFELTSDGEILLDKCESIFSIFQDIDDLFNAKEGVYRGKIAFGCSHSFALSYLPTCYKTLLTKYPEVEPLMRLGHSGIIREWINKGEIEFGIIQGKEEDSVLFNTLPILHVKHGIYKSKNETKPILDKLIISQNTREDNFLLNELKNKNKKLPPLIEILSWEVIASMIEEGLGVGMLPDYVAKKYNLVPIRMKISPINYSLIAIWSKKKELSRNAKLFIELISNS